MNNGRRILGIDPGTNVLGFGVLQAEGQRLTVIDMGVVTFRHVGEEQTAKLKYIFEQVQDIILQHHPTEMAIEAPFFGKNVQSMLKLGRAQGVAIAAGMVNALTIAEYMPKKIKRSVTGNGNASKEQVAGMLETILQAQLSDQYLDATDALAAAVCHFFQGKQHAGGDRKAYSGWDAFVRDNPARKR